MLQEPPWEALKLTSSASATVETTSLEAYAFYLSLRKGAQCPMRGLKTALTLFFESLLGLGTSLPDVGVPCTVTKAELEPFQEGPIVQVNPLCEIRS